MSGSVCQGYPLVKEHVARKNESCVSYFPWLCGFTRWQAAGKYAIFTCWLSEIGVSYTDTTMVDFSGTTPRIVSQHYYHSFFLGIREITWSFWKFL